MMIRKEWKENPRRGTTEKKCPWCSGVFTDYEIRWKDEVVMVTCAELCGFSVALGFEVLGREEVVRYLQGKRPIFITC